jgi:RpiR family transcriptional regulator, carbohydrate utilization regulator
LLENSTPDLNMDAVARLRAFYPSLSPSEKLVADFILMDPNRIPYMTMAEIAVGSGVSDATAVRFFRSLGYENFLNLKIALTRSIKETAHLIHEDISASDTAGTIMKKVFQRSIGELEETIAVINPEAFNQTVKLLSGAKVILVVGMMSSNVAEELCSRLCRLGLNCHSPVDGYSQISRVALLGARDALVVISQTGEPKTLLKLVNEARFNHCPVVGIVGNALSPIGQLADIVLLTISHEMPLESLSSRVAQHGLVQALYVALAARSMNSTIEKERKILDALVRQPG